MTADELFRVRRRMAEREHLGVLESELVEQVRALREAVDRGVRQAGAPSTLGAAGVTVAQATTLAETTARLVATRRRRAVLEASIARTTRTLRAELARDRIGAT